MWQRILDDGATYDTSSLLEVLTGTSRVDLDLIDALKARFPGTWTSVAYGSTEIGRGAVLLDSDLYAKPVSVGQPPPVVDARIDADDELLQRGPTMFSGYLDRPDATADAIDADGWFHTGDLATRDADGYLTITGRRSESIRSGGEWVAPVEVEAAVLTHPAVAEVGVVGLPDPRWGELVCAAIVARPGATLPTVEELRAHVASRLVGPKHPRVVVPSTSSPTPTPPARSAAPRCAPRSSPTAAMSPGSRTSDISNERDRGAARPRNCSSGPPARTPDAVVHRLLAVQAQDARGARLAVRSRSVGLHATDVDDALNDGRLVITWVNRGTLHLVGAEDYWWLHPLTTPQLETGNRRRLREEGVSERQAERGRRRRRRGGGRTGHRRAPSCGSGSTPRACPTAGQALVHVLLAATLRGHVVRGPMRGAEHAFVAVSDWLGDAPEPLDRPDALARLARRYLAGHGPADARRSRALGGHHAGRRADRLRRHRRRGRRTARTVSSISSTVRTPAGLPKPRLLGPFDPLLLGWVSRDPLVGTHQGSGHHQRTVPGVRARQRSRRRDVDPERRDVDAEAARAGERHRGHGAARRCRRRGAVPRPARRDRDRRRSALIGRRLIGGCLIR